MDAIRKPDIMHKVGCAAEILAPLARRALMCKPLVSDSSQQPSGCDRSRHITRQEAWEMTQKEQNEEVKVLLMLACRGLSPKLHSHCIPEVHALCEGLESVINKLREDTTFPEPYLRPCHLTDAEIRGVTCLSMLIR